ncbi:MAG: glycosyltransferase [Bacteroidetes bacterium]|nr:MAG: glycosyltransferase [Bacteroidota bacterium]
MMLLAVIGVVMMLLGILYTVILLTALSGLSIPVKETLPLSVTEPFVSVIIPVRNEKHQIGSCLQSLIQQDYPSHRFELIISDDFSDDRTEEQVTRFFQEKSFKNWRIQTGDSGKHPEFGKKKAIERAIDIALGTLILTTDADTTHHPGWISSMIKCHLETGAKMILGPVMLAGESNPFQKMQTLEFLGVMGLTAGFANLGHPLMCNGANLCYEKEVFHEVGGFQGNEQYISGDDQFLLWKVKQRFGGKSIRFPADPDAIVTTPPAADIRSFLRQRLRWISKSRGYRDKLVLLTGAVTYLFQAIIVTGFFLGFLSPLYLYLGVSLFCFKVLADFPLVFSMARFFGKQRLWPWYLPAQLFQVVYVTLSGPLAFLVQSSWKGRKV